MVETETYLVWHLFGSFPIRHETINRARVFVNVARGWMGLRRCWGVTRHSTKSSILNMLVGIDTKCVDVVQHGAKVWW